jgi:hypothetical protein
MLNKINIKKCFFVFASFLLTSLAFASPVNSLEWLVDVRDKIGIYRVVNVSEKELDNSEKWIVHDIHAELKENLKGKCPEKVHFTQRRGKHPALFIKKDDLVLLFFKPKSGPTIETPKGVFPPDPNIIEVDVKIFLSNKVLSIITSDPDLFFDYVISKDFKVRKNKDEILKIVKDRIKLKIKHWKFNEPDETDNWWHMPRGCITQNFPEDFFSKLNVTGTWSIGGPTSLTVPADPELKPKIEEIKAGDMWEKRTLIYRSAQYPPGNDLIKLLKELLKNEEKSPYKATMDKDILKYPEGKDLSLVWSNEKKSEVEYFPVRQAAYEALLRFGVKVDRPEGTLLLEGYR